MCQQTAALLIIIIVFFHIFLFLLVIYLNLRNNDESLVTFKIFISKLLLLVNYLFFYIMQNCDGQAH